MKGFIAPIGIKNDCRTSGWYLSRIPKKAYPFYSTTVSGFSRKNYSFHMGCLLSIIFVDYKSISSGTILS